MGTVSTLQADQYIAVVAPSKTMVEKLVCMEQVDSARVAPAGVSKKMLQWICRSTLVTVQRWQLIFAGRQLGSGGENWQTLLEAHEALQVHLFVQAYPQPDARETVVKGIQVLVSTADFLCKLLGRNSDWSRTFHKKSRRRAPGRFAGNISAGGVVAARGSLR